MEKSSGTPTPKECCKARWGHSKMCKNYTNTDVVMTFDPTSCEVTSASVGGKPVEIPPRCKRCNKCECKCDEWYAQELAEEKFDGLKAQRMPHAIKKDEGKLRYDLLPALPLQDLVSVLTFGANKYEDRNWEKGFKYSRVFAAIMRHCWAFWRGETIDPETGLHHLAHAAINCMFLIEFEYTNKGEDDRPCKLK